MPMRRLRERSASTSACGSEGSGARVSGATMTMRRAVAGFMLQLVATIEPRTGSSWPPVTDVGARKQKARLKRALFTKQKALAGVCGRHRAAQPAAERAQGPELR